MKKLLTFFTLVGALLCLALPARAVDYYVAGDFTNPTWESGKVQMTSTSDGKYVTTVTTSKADALFKIIKVTTSDGSTTNTWIGKDNTTVTWAATITSIGANSGSGDNIKIANAGTYRIVFTPNGDSSTLQVYPSLLYISGDAVGSGDSGLSNVFTRDESTEGVFSGSIDLSSSSGWFRLGFASSLSSSNGIYTSDNNQTFWSNDSGENNIYFGNPQSYVLQNSGSWTISVDLLSGKISYTRTDSGPATPVITVNTASNTVTISCATEGATIYYTTNGDTPTSSSEEYTKAITIPTTGYSKIQAIAVKGEKVSEVASVENVTWHVAAPNIDVTTTTDGRGKFTMSTDVEDGQIIYNVGSSTIRNVYTDPYYTSDPTTITAWVEVNGLSSDKVTASWTNVVEKDPIYYIGEIMGWSKTVGDDANVPNVIAIPWDATQQAYVLSIAIGNETGTSNLFRFTKSSDGTDWSTSFTSSEDWNTVNAKCWYVTSTLQAGLEGVEQTAVLTETSSQNNISVSKIGYWTFKIDENLTTLTYSWNGVISEESVTPQAWSLSDDSFPVGTTKYFYLSGEQNDSRVSPEWELEKEEGTDEDGNTIYAIKDFMVVPAGQFIIRQIDRNASEGKASDYTITDWGYSGSTADKTYHINDETFNLPTDGSTAEKKEYSHTMSTAMGANATRGYFWNIGYTMASVEVKRKELKPVYVENDGRAVIYYKGDFTALWLWNTGTGTEKSFDDNGATDANGYKHYALKSGESYTKVILKYANDDNWDNGQYPAKDSGVTLTFSAGDHVVIDTNKGLVAYENFTELTAFLTVIANLKEPSTLKVAPKQGIPYVSLMGEVFSTLRGDTDPAYTYVANLNSGGDNQSGSAAKGAYTNGFIYHNEEGVPVTYGDTNVATLKGTRSDGTTTELYVLRDKEDNMNTSAATSSSDNSAFYIKYGALINSTRQPPVNPIKFLGTKNGQVVELTSNELRLDWQEVTEETFTDGTVTTNKIKVVKYETKNLPLLGMVKVFSGNGSQRYGSVWNGLSLYSNWGAYGSDGGSGVYKYKNAKSKADVPLSGAGAYHHMSSHDRTERAANTRSIYYDDNSKGDYQYEDNAAGNYINFTDRSYVSTAQFFYALEYDGQEGVHDVKYTDYDNSDNSYNNTGYDGNGEGEVRPTNTGRNYSWLRFTFTDADQRIELDKVGSNTGRITYAINEDGSEDVWIVSYTVSLYEVDKNGNKLSKEPVRTTDLITISGTSTHTIDETILLEEDLEVGWYRAEIVTTFGYYDDYGKEQVKEPITDMSRIIQVRAAAGKPSISATQLTYGPDDENPVKVYTLDVEISSNLSSFAKANAEEDDDFVYYDMSAKLTIPGEPGNKLMINGGSGYVDITDGSSGTSDSSLSYTVTKGDADDDGNFTWTCTVTGFTGEDNVTLPTFKVVNTLPGETYQYKIEAYVKDAASDDNSRTATVTIKAPLAKYVGSAKFDAQWDADALDGRTAVKIADGKFVLIDPDDDDAETPAALAASTLKDFSLSFGVAYKDNASTASFTVNKETLEVQTTEVSAPAENLPYHPDTDSENGYKVAAKDDQQYAFATTLTYYRGTIASNTGSADVEELSNTISLGKVTLNSPREGLKDTKAQNPASFITDDQYNLPAGRDSRDYVRIMTTWQEKWSGVNNQVEDALIAAEVTQPTQGTVFRFDAAKQTIKHHDESIFNPEKHHFSKDKKDGTDKNAPGYSAASTEDLEALYAATTKTLHTEAHSNFVERVGAEFKSTSLMYQGNYDNSNNLLYYITSANDFNDERFTLWAGCKKDGDDYEFVADSFTEDGKTWTRKVDFNTFKTQYGYIEAGTFDKADGTMGYYGSRNHHARKGWQGGEYFSRDWFVQAFAKTAKNEATSSVEVAELITAPTDGKEDKRPFTDATTANYVLEVLSPFIESGTGLPLEDAKLVTGKSSLEFGKKVYLDAFGADPSNASATESTDGTAITYDADATGRVMLKVNHVNHESWYGNAANVLEQFGYDTNNFNDKLLQIRISTAWYTPVVYDFRYEYPMVTTVDEATLGSAKAVVAQAQTASLLSLRTATTDETSATVEPVVARATGLIAFDDAVDEGSNIQTAIQSVGADAAGANGRYFSYSRESQVLTVISTDGVKGVSVAAVDGRVMKQANGRGAETFTVSLADLAEGYYVVTAEGVGSIKLLK